MQDSVDATEDPVDDKLVEGNADTLHSHSAGSSGAARTADQDKALAAAGLADDELDREACRQQERVQLMASLKVRNEVTAKRTQKPIERKRTRQADRLAADGAQGAGTSTQPAPGAGKKQKNNQRPADDQDGGCFLLKDVAQLSKMMPVFLNNPDIVPLWKKAGVISITKS